PNSADPGPDPDEYFSSKQLREFIDVDPSLAKDMRNKMYQVVEQNKIAFGFDGRLGQLEAQVHINVMPGTRPYCRIMPHQQTEI
ncbi:hypothetical protein DL93DRAFT_2197072, partial [Clavulina sp. PMI_390]